MTVKELREQLATFDEETDVVFVRAQDGYVPSGCLRLFRGVVDERSFTAYPNKDGDFACLEFMEVL